MFEEQEELRTKDLFQRLKRDDERRAPRFAVALETAIALGERSHRGHLIPRMKLALGVLLIVTAALAGLWFKAYTNRLTTTELAVQPPDAPAIQIPPVPQREVPILAVTVNKPRESAHRHHALLPPLPMSALISQWRSPTEFLLKTTEARWMKEVPRLGAPQLQIEFPVIERKNEMEEQ